MYPVTAIGFQTSALKRSNQLSKFVISMGEYRLGKFFALLKELKEYLKIRRDAKFCNKDIRNLMHEESPYFNMKVVLQELKKDSLHYESYAKMDLKSMSFVGRFYARPVCLLSKTLVMYRNHLEYKIKQMDSVTFDEHPGLEIISEDVLWQTRCKQYAYLA
jgi:hypothetical protein